jgi:DnaJ family protein B protein 4
MVKETKLYDQLNISPTATQDEIKKAYRYVRCPLLFSACLSRQLPEKRRECHQTGMIRSLTALGRLFDELPSDHQLDPTANPSPGKPP